MAQSRGLTFLRHPAYLRHMPKNEHLLTAAEAAQRIGMPLRTFQYHAAVGNVTHALKLPGATGAYLFDAEAVDAFAARREGVAS